MPTVAQYLTAHRDLSGDARYTLAEVTAVSGRMAELVGRPGAARLRARIPVDVTARAGDVVLVLSTPAVTTIIVRMEAAP